MNFLWLWVECGNNCDIILLIKNNVCDDIVIFNDYVNLWIGKLYLYNYFVN